MSDALHPIAVLIDELRHEDVHYRLNAIRRLHTVALALGEERTRAELLPFLEESVEDEDEVLAALAEQVGGLVAYIGGPAQAHALLPLLEHLCQCEETLVRDRACKAVGEVVGKMAAVNGWWLQVAPAVQRLAQGEWFTSRVSAASVLGSVHALLGEEERAPVRGMLDALVKDETPMVRRAVASVLPAVCRDAIVKHAQECLAWLAAVSQDDQDSVRLLGVNVALAVVEAGEAQVVEQVLPVLKRQSSDPSWRVRYVVGEKYAKLSLSLKHKLQAAAVFEEWLHVFGQLLKDPEAECRAVTASLVGEVVSVMTPRAVDELLLAVKELCQDASHHVRTALAKSVTGLAPVLGKERTLQQLVPVFIQCLRDDCSDVRLGLIARLDQVGDVVGREEVVTHVLPAITALAEDKSWRVREAIIEHVPLLAKQLGRDFFDRELSAWLWRSCGDGIYAIRASSAKQVGKLCGVFGWPWVTGQVMPKLQEWMGKDVFTWRMMVVLVVRELVAVAGDEKDARTVIVQTLPMVMQLTQDPVPNIRFSAVETLMGMVKFVDKEVVKKRLVEMQGDRDGDVREWVGRAVGVY